jgi:hypothetical protein
MIDLPKESVTSKLKGISTPDSATKAPRQVPISNLVLDNLQAEKQNAKHKKRHKKFKIFFMP